MIHEYALEPAVINSWERLQRVMSQFGFQTGRLIGRVPGKYRKAVLDALPDTLPDTERSKIAARLKDFEDSVMVARKHDWNGEHWLTNVLSQQANAPFRLILCAADHEPPLVMAYKELDEFSPPAGWDADDGDVPRTPLEMAKRLRLVVQTAKRFIRIVDPNFHPASMRFRSVFVEICAHIRAAHEFRVSTELELHISDKCDSTSLEREALTNLASELPSGSVLKIVQWPASKMHNRYVLTEKVGVLIGHGTDQNQKGTAGVETDSFTLLRQPSWQDQVAKYSIEGSPLGIPSTIRVTSTREPFENGSD